MGAGWGEEIDSVEDGEPDVGKLFRMDSAARRGPLECRRMQGRGQPQSGAIACRRAIGYFYGPPPKSNGSLHPAA